LGIELSAQVSHWLEPVLLLKVLPSHRWHATAPSEENFPAPHSVHAVFPTPAWNLPASHWVHSAAPSEFDMLPGMHGCVAWMRVRIESIGEEKTKQKSSTNLHLTSQLAAPSRRWTSPGKHFKQNVLPRSVLK
jgi:hypothetical protein